MKKYFILQIIVLKLFFVSNVYAELPAYKIYTKDGKPVVFSDIVEAGQESDIILFGELHNNPISHWLQFELSKYLYSKLSNRLVIGAEMFESDDQLKIDEYFSGLIPQNNFEREARLWNNYKTDYKPILEFAKSVDLRFIATNIPRRYAAFVARNGLAALDNFPAASKNYFPPLPIEVDLDLPGYAKMESMKMEMPVMQTKAAVASEPAPEQIISAARLEEMRAERESHLARVNMMKEAQAVKDATMAHFILKNMSRNSVFLHFHGTYHSDNFEGIYWFLKKHSPNKKIITISTVEQEVVLPLSESNQGLADFILVVPSSMTKTN